MSLLPQNLVNLPLHTKLNVKCKDYVRRSEEWENISTYYRVDTAMSLRSLILPQRIGEPDILYNKRLSNFVFTPVLYNTVKQFVKGLRNSPAIASVEAPPLMTLQGNPFDWDVLGGEICRNWMVYGRAILLFDGVNMQIIDPRSMINYGNGFWVIYAEREESALYKETITIKTWIVIQYIQGTEASFSYQKYESVKGEEPRLVLDLVIDTYYPILVLDCSEDIWVASRAWALQRLHCLLDNWILDSASNLYIQRNLIQREADANTMYEDEGQFTSNGHLVIGDFRFTEAAGTSVTTSMALLASTEEKIRDTISMQNIDTARDISGESKKYDKSEQDASYRSMGAVVKKALETTALYMLGTPITFTGYNQYELDFSVVLDRTAILDKMVNLPPEIWSKWTKKLDGYIENM